MATGAVAAVAGAASAFVGGIDEVFQTLLVLVVADVVTGVARAAKQGNVWSRRAFVGGLQKLGIFVAVGVATALDRYLGGPDDPAVLRASVCAFYIAVEGISIIENLGELGVPVPEALTKTFRKLRDGQGQGQGQEG